MFPKVEVGDIWEFHDLRGLNVPPERYLVLEVLGEDDGCSIKFVALHCCTDTGGMIDNRWMFEDVLQCWRKVA